MIITAKIYHYIVVKGRRKIFWNDLLRKYAPTLTTANKTMEKGLCGAQL